MYQIVIRPTCQQDHLVFEGHHKSEAEQHAARWCLNETQQHPHPTEHATLTRLQDLWSQGLHREVLEAYLQENGEVQLLHAGEGQLVVLGGLKALQRWAQAQLLSPAGLQTTLLDHPERPRRAG